MRVTISILALSLIMSGCKDESAQKDVVQQESKPTFNKDLYSVEKPPEPKEILVAPVEEEEEVVPDYIPEVSFPDTRPLLREQMARSLRGRRSYLSKNFSTPIAVTKRDDQYHLQDDDYQKGETTFDQDLSTLPVDRTRILTADMRISALLEDGINTQMPGRVIAIVDRDVLSPNGRKILLPAYSKVICSYEGLSEANSSRLSMQCRRIIRPDGVSIALTDATTADQMGRSGVSGDLDNRSFEKYGAAFGISLISALAQSSASLNNNEAFGNATNQLSNNLGQVTQQVLEKNLDIRPILTIPQGTRIQIIPVNDIVLMKPLLKVNSHFPSSHFSSQNRSSQKDISHD